MKLRDLLDFKQKQANVSEAHSARQQAEEAKNQGQSIMVFTIITIIFVSTLNGHSYQNLNSHLTATIVLHCCNLQYECNRDQWSGE
jgi:hypothetical protein